MTDTSREALIAALRDRHLKTDTREVMLKAADMLESDATELTRLRDLARDAANAATQLQKQVLAHKAQQVAVPVGWALVPIEPTKEMLWAAKFYDYTNPTDPTWGGIYKVMLAAAQGDKP